MIQSPPAPPRERKAAFTTLSGIPVKRVYTPVDVAGTDPLEDIGLPGEFPYTRGPYATMYRGRLWTMRQFAGFGTPRQTNERFKFLLAQGMTGLSTAFHLPTLIGYDSDHPTSAGEVGRCGVAVDTLADMEALFDGIRLDTVSTSMTINATAIIALAFYFAVAEKQGVPLDRVSGTIQNDILKEYIAQKEWIVPVEPALRLITDICAFCAREAPRFNTISISGYHIREAGATAVQELAFTLIDGLTYVERGVAAGLDVDDFAPRLSFFWDVHNDFFEEIAKFRAARRIWAREMRRRYNPRNPRSLMLRTHAQTAGVTLTAQQPMNNVVRVALQALAAVLGGTQSLHTNSLDETYALPTAEAALLALRTQQVIAFESGVANTVDPLAGSYYVEALTNKMEEGFYEYLHKIEALGGMVAAIQQGFPQMEITESAYRAQAAIDRGDEVVVGVNKYVVPEERPIPTLKIDRAIEEEQVANLRRVRAQRDPRRWSAALEGVRRAAAEGSNLMPPILEAARAYASIGEIVEVLQSVFGTYRDPAFF